MCLSRSELKPGALVDKGTSQLSNSTQCNDHRSDEKCTRIHTRVHERQKKEPYASTLKMMINSLDEQDPRKSIGRHASGV